MKELLPILVFFIFSSCIPLRIAPKIMDDKVMVAKKFKRSLPRNYAFIFQDPKNADEFYNFINMKFDLGYQDVEWNVPFSINDETYFLSFYETEIPTKTLNLIPIMVDFKRESNGNTPLFEDAHFSRIGNWYLVITVYNSEMRDCLEPQYESRSSVLKYLRDLRLEYLNTHNYLETLLKNR
jgi:hypothetical protein